MIFLFAFLLTSLPMPVRPAPILCEPVPVVVCDVDPDTGEMVMRLDYVLACGPLDP